MYSIEGVTNSILGTRRRQVLEVSEFPFTDIRFKRRRYFPQVHSVLTSFFVYSVVIFINTTAYNFLEQDQKFSRYTLENAQIAIIHTFIGLQERFRISYCSRWREFSKVKNASKIQNQHVCAISMIRSANPPKQSDPSRIIYRPKNETTLCEISLKLYFTAYPALNYPSTRGALWEFSYGFHKRCIR